MPRYCRATVSVAAMPLTQGAQEGIVKLTRILAKFGDEQ